jgi:hypothetical protein
MMGLWPGPLERESMKTAVADVLAGTVVKPAMFW